MDLRKHYISVIMRTVVHVLPDLDEPKCTDLFYRYDHDIFGWAQRMSESRYCIEASVTKIVFRQGMYLPESYKPRTLDLVPWTFYVLLRVSKDPYTLQLGEAVGSPKVAATCLLETNAGGIW